MTWEDAVLWLTNHPDKKEFARQCYYDEPILDSTNRFLESEEWEGITELLGDLRGKKILEIGAGRGLVSFGFAKAGAEVTALEPDKSNIVGSGAMRRLKADGNISFDIAETFGETLPFESDKFDIVFCRCVLHHAYDLPKMCSEIFRVLRRGGVFLADREHVISGPEQLDGFLKAHPLHFLYGGENAFELKVYQDALKKTAGFRRVKSFASYDHKINFLPHADAAQIRKMAFEALRKAHIPVFLARKIAATKFFFDFYKATLSWRDKNPGRFYSFLATK